MGMTKPPPSPYRQLQLRCKAAGLPANKSFDVLSKQLAEYEASQQNGASCSATSPDLYTAGGETADGTGHLIPGPYGPEWRPDYPVTYAPLFPLLSSLLQFSPSAQQWSDLYWWFFGYPGYLWPWNVIYFTICYLTYTYTNPEISRCTEYRFDWIAELYVRNLGLLWMIAGGWHALLYTFKAQGTMRKHDPRWQATNSDRFVFGDQVYDNVFWSCVSGVGTWTAFEAHALHSWANGTAEMIYTDWWSSPWYSICWLLLIPIWREFHFYVGHRALHWKPIYPYIHYLHHKNDNPGPWSGLAMHPIEHIIYFSVVLIHFVVPSHPLHFFFNSQHTALTPAGGHSGFEGPVINGTIPAGSYFHYLHHRYYDFNYGEATIPLDKLFGTFKDGSPDGYGSKSKK